MKARLSTLWYWLRSSLWLVPTLMVILAVMLSFISATIDSLVKFRVLEKLEWMYLGSPNGARAVLSTIAGSMITVAGVTFSITIVALQLASSQFGPRILRNFMRDIGNQVVLGTFIGTFLYCLLVLRQIRDVEERGIVVVPYISVTFGIFLAVVSLGVLIYFIHHVAASIQVDNITASISRDLNGTIDQIFPEEMGHGLENDVLPEPELQRFAEDLEDVAIAVLSTGSGYLQAIDTDELMEIAVHNDLVLRLQHRPGKFIIEGNPLVLVWPRERASEAIARSIRGVFVLGSQRTPTQDIEFAVHQLVEIAVRALSPSVNDPFSAVTCISWLGVALTRLTHRRIPSPYRYDDQKRIRIIAYPVTFSGVVDAAFSQIRQYGKSSATIMIHMLEVIITVASQAQKEEERSALLRHALMVERDSRESLGNPWDVRDLEERYRAAIEVLEKPSSTESRA